MWASNLWANNFWSTDMWTGYGAGPAQVTGEPTDAPTVGGYESFAGENLHVAARQRLKKRQEELRRHRQTIRRINRWR